MYIKHHVFIDTKIDDKTIAIFEDLYVFTLSF